MYILSNILVFLALAAFMEVVAWWTHKHVMHGFLWVLHEDHHRPRGRGLQKNDLFAVFFSLLSFVLIYNGLRLGLGRSGPARWWMLLASAGFGVALYGVGYVLFHDIMFHRRIRGLRIPARHPYLQRIIRAHRVHHQAGGKENSVSFGFLYAGREYDVARTGERP
jgi:beta-carotene 3-hydroxylase